MENKNRRNFLKSFAGGVAGVTILPVFGTSLTTPLEEINHNLISNSKDTSESFWEGIKQQFHFAPGVHYFNNASLGSSPIAIRKATRDFRDTLDDFPSKYMWGGWTEQKEQVRQKVANVFSVDKEEIALIHNTTEGMNLIARSFDFQPGDEVIIANHDHTSAYIPWEVWQKEKGIKLVRPTLPILPKTKAEIVTLYEQAITSKTKIISICHIVNTNGMILPVKEISEMAHKRGILVAVDGAQSGGMFAY